MCGSQAPLVLMQLRVTAHHLQRQILSTGQTYYERQFSDEPAGRGVNGPSPCAPPPHVWVSRPLLLWCRDGSTVHINNKGQFSDQPASRACKSAAARAGPDHKDSDEDDGLLDLDEEEDQRRYSGSHRGNQAGPSGQEEEGLQAEGTSGRWATHNNHKVMNFLVMITCVILCCRHHTKPKRLMHR